MPVRHYPLYTSVEIGRDPSRCHIVLDDPKVSASHGKLLRQGNVYYLQDVGSMNGVTVNGTRIDRRTLLYDGDRIRLGDTVFVFKKL
ncbi:MAG: FHA domain-containing protein [Chloroflexi bacterium]|nr:FHA domain-containing protein [Chloroflexota bacterium]